MCANYDVTIYYIGIYILYMKAKKLNVFRECSLWAHRIIIKSPSLSLSLCTCKPFAGIRKFIKELSLVEVGGRWAWLKCKLRDTFACARVKVKQVICILGDIRVRCQCLIPMRNGHKRYRLILWPYLFFWLRFLRADAASKTVPKNAIYIHIYSRYRESYIARQPGKWAKKRKERQTWKATRLTQYSKPQTVAREGRKRDIERKGGGVRKVERQSKAIKMHFYEQNY